MESNSKANRIHCSKAAAKLLQVQGPEIPLKSRGFVSVKGKGEMETYWVNDNFRTKLRSAKMVKNQLRGKSKNDSGGQDAGGMDSGVSHDSTAGGFESSGINLQIEDTTSSIPTSPHQSAKASVQELSDTALAPEAAPAEAPLPLPVSRSPSRSTASPQKIAAPAQAQLLEQNGDKNVGNGKLNKHFTRYEL